MTILALLFGIATLPWLIPMLSSGRVVPIAVLTMMVGVVLGPAFWSIDGPIAISLDRMLWPGLLLASAIAWRRGDLQFPKLGRLDWLIIAFVGYMLISCLRGGTPPSGSSPVAKWIFYIALPAATFFIVRCNPITTDDIKVMRRGLVLLGLYLALTGICEWKEIHSLVYPRHILDPTIREFYGRARGPLLNPIGNGILMGVAAAITFIQMFRSRPPGVLLNMGLLMVLMAGVYATLTRSCWLGAAGGIGMIVCIYAPRWVRGMGIASVVILAVAMSMGLKDQLLAIKRDKDLSAAEAAKSVELRPLLAVVAWEMIKDKPLFGHGFGHYFQHNGPYHDARQYGLPLSIVRVYRQHNTFLAILVDGGLLGFAMMMTIWTVFAVKACRVARRMDLPIEGRVSGLIFMAMLVIFIANGMFHDLIIIDMMQITWMIMAATVVRIDREGLTRTVQENQIPIASQLSYQHRSRETAPVYGSHCPAQ
ncbi:MAG: O-antigen ligase family protein [Planctomycetota bacterium]